MRALHEVGGVGGARGVPLSLTRSRRADPISYSTRRRARTRPQFGITQRCCRPRATPRARADELAVALDVARADASRRRARRGARSRLSRKSARQRCAAASTKISEELQSSRASLTAAAPPPAVAGDDVLATLQVIGIEQHAARLADDEIDVETLALLTEADMRELGLPMGAIVRLRKWQTRRAAPAERGAARGEAMESSARSAWSARRSRPRSCRAATSQCASSARAASQCHRPAASRTRDGLAAVMRSEEGA